MPAVKQVELNEENFFWAQQAFVQQVNQTE